MTAQPQLERRRLVRSRQQCGGSGRLTLLGDAAHPMLPHTVWRRSALDDAVELGAAVPAELSGIDRALAGLSPHSSRRAQMVTAGSIVTRLASLLPTHEAPPAHWNVLIVDDEEPILQFVERVLQRGGYDTVTASSGLAALDAKSPRGEFDLVVTDLMMPEMDGEELVRRMRQRLPDIKALYLTGFIDLLFAERMLLSKHEAFLEKPCSVRGLLEAVALALTGRVPTGRLIVEEKS